KINQLFHVFFSSFLEIPAFPQAGISAFPGLAAPSAARNAAAGAGQAPICHRARSYRRPFIHFPLRQTERTPAAFALCQAAAVSGGCFLSVGPAKTYDPLAVLFTETFRFIMPNVLQFSILYVI